MLDGGKQLGVLLIDFKKAIDSVCHTTSVSVKMQASGIGGNLLDWLNDYLKNHRQFVKIGGHTSDTKRIDYNGVPQGSLLGPRLFGIKVTDLSERTENGIIEMFADDTESYCTGDSPDEVTLGLQVILQDINLRCKKNGPMIHQDKTEAMIISPKSFIGPLQALCLEDHYVKFVTQSECLGMTVDNTLSWKAQIQRVSKTLSSKLKILKWIKCLSTPVKESIYFKGLLPSATYRISVWGTCSPEVLEPLEKIH